MIIDLNEDNFEQETSKGIRLVEFYATWCIYCKKQRMELENFKDSDIWIGIVDGDESPNLVKKYNISGYPTFVVLKNGEKIGEFAGLHDKSQLLSSMMQYISG